MFNLVAPKIKAKSQNALPKFQEFILVLMRLKLNVAFQDLSHWFGVSAATASCIFDRWINVINKSCI